MPMHSGRAIRNTRKPDTRSARQLSRKRGGAAVAVGGETWLMEIVPLKNGRIRETVPLHGAGRSPGQVIDPGGAPQGSIVGEDGLTGGRGKSSVIGRAIATGQCQV